MKNRRFFAAAHVAYHRALKDGVIARAERCERCGCGGRIDGHHRDYARPFDVEWLCPKCHKAEHAEEDAARNALGPTMRAGTPKVVGTVTCERCNGTGKTGFPRPLTAKQRELYEYIWYYSREHGFAPSFNEIAAARGYTTLATVHEHMNNLEQKFWIARRFNEARAISCLVNIDDAEGNVA